MPMYKSEVPDNAIISKLGKAADDLIDVMTSAKFGDNRFKGGLSGDVQNLPFSLYWSAKQQASTNVLP